MHLKPHKKKRSVGQMAVGQARFEAYNFKELILLFVFVMLTL